MKFRILEVVLIVRLIQIKNIKIYIPALFIIVLDQISKIWIDNNLPIGSTRNFIGEIIQLTHVKNPGIAFGISVGDYRLLLIFLSIIATLYIAHIHWRERENHIMIVTSFSLILGGAIGNLIDRLLIVLNKYIGVIDFIDARYFGFPWIFNIADSGVTVGVILYLCFSIYERRQSFIQNEIKP